MTNSYRKHSGRSMGDERRSRWGGYKTRISIWLVFHLVSKS